ncbi:MAG: addiction module antidote protein [Wenzhouxiangella sp.]
MRSSYYTAGYLNSEEDIRLYLDACQEEGNPALILAALGDIARTRNMTALAKEAGLTRAGLYKVLSAEGNPSFATVAAIAKALGLQIKIQQTIA